MVTGRLIPFIFLRAGTGFFQDRQMKHPKAAAPIAITMGDAAGIGPEIIVRHFTENAVANVFVIGDAGQIDRAARLFGRDIPISVMAELPEELPSGIPVLSVGTLPRDLPYGKVDARAGKLAYDAVLRGIALAKAGQISAIVTAPLHKEALHAAGVPFPGHTEILAHETGTSDFGMMLIEGALRVILVSIHVPLLEAIRRVTVESVSRTIRLADQGCRALGIEKPRIAVAGLNPHAGEGGLFGQEDDAIIAPAIRAMREKGFDVSGPYPPDTVFMQSRRGRFDIVVAQYHDQGLIPIKLLGIEKGVNITVGLPIIRTSVDHGTAFDIAGKGIADPSSLAEAILVARQMAAARR
jgi:4-hydroxythreonine-4-phosphate dehydrogenase